MLRKQAMEMLLTGDFIGAAQAKEQGLINQVVQSEALPKSAIDLARKILSKPEAAVRAGKQLFYTQLEVGIEQAYQLASQAMACNIPMLWRGSVRSCKSAVQFGDRTGVLDFKAPSSCC
jgi:enoyl-CoA hydratase/carnithine racemase